MKPTFFFLLAISWSVSAFGGDGIIFDENGLTIIVGEKPLVDNSRWNSSDGIYTLTNGNPGYVKAIKNEQGKVVAVKKAFGNINELHANGVFSEDSVTVTTNFCKQLEAQKVDLESRKCQNFLGDFFKLYESQATETVLKTLQDVAKLDGIAPVVNMEALALSFKNQSMNMKILVNKSIIANIGYLAQRCADLKRYSSDEVATFPQAPLNNESKSIIK